MPSRHSSGLGPGPADPAPPSPKIGSAHGERLRPSPALTYLLLRAPGEAVRGVRGRGRLHPAAGRAAGAAPLASPRGQPQGGGMAAALPAVHGAQGEGKGNEVNRILRQEAFPRPSLGSAAAPHSSPQTAPEPRPRRPAAPRRADTKESEPRCLRRCPATAINKCSPRLRRGRARLSRRGARGSGRGPGSSTVSRSPALQRRGRSAPRPARSAPPPPPCGGSRGRQRCERQRWNGNGRARSAESRAARHGPAASRAVPSRAGSSGARGGCSSPRCEREPGPRPRPAAPRRRNEPATVVAGICRNREEEW